MVRKLMNISGEPREYKDEGYIYEFPIRTDTPTEVPDSVADKLLLTKQFKDVTVEKKAVEFRGEAGFKDKMMEIKGIGEKIARDIVNIYKSERDLVKALKEEKHIPIEDDIVKLLKKNYDKEV